MLTPIIDVLLSLIFIYLLFSIMAGMFNESYVRLRNRRGEFLKASLDELLNDKHNFNFSALLYLHPIIDLTKRDKDTLPSYISANNFSTAIIDIIGGLSDQKGLVQNQETKEVTYFESRNKDAYDRFKKGLDTMLQSDLKIILQSHVDHASDLVSLQQRIEQWFNDYGERTTGWYKIKQSKRLFVIGLLMSIALNINSITLVQAIYVQEGLRNSIASAAVNWVNSHPALPAGPDSTQGLPAQAEEIRKQYTEISKLNLPIGWQLVIAQFKSDGYNAADVFVNVCWMLLGWLITAVMISFGAPFWFDAINKVVNIRRTGLKPEDK